MDRGEEEVLLTRRGLGTYSRPEDVASPLRVLHYYGFDKDLWLQRGHLVLRNLRASEVSDDLESRNAVYQVIGPPAFADLFGPWMNRSF